LQISEKPLFLFGIEIAVFNLRSIKGVLSMYDRASFNEVNNRTNRFNNN
jgi:hypothetical protein